MKLVCLSDSHGFHRELNVPSGDILCVAGDIGFESSYDPKPLEDFNDWLGNLDFKSIVVVAGNHDFYCEKHPQETRALLTNCCYLNHEAARIMGLNFFGSPYSPQFGWWAFMSDRGEPLKQKWAQIPDNTDVVITHAPVAGILDEVEHYGHVGDEDLGRRLYQIKPKVHIAGHYHLCGGQFQKVDGTIFVNASVVDECYDPVHQIVTLDI